MAEKRRDRVGSGAGTAPLRRHARVATFLPSGLDSIRLVDRELEANPALETFRWEAVWARARALNVAGRAAEGEAAAELEDALGPQHSATRAATALA